ncbi:transcription factor bHLH18-like [Juglans microcarpa x Juglans regia]|uniref:transcription factor bHLH18-like n=1 Tax=Juglans microcarpa x Juglans regia TaxID=2249226 RepID=UPI001B7E2E6A|nr:transcription factor bHLH18-like [Juglans microcarpa x Juglans regia]XP_041016565.1 transcription factor bHLH18-like [Juglans microcarpa x Juglans regia]
MELSSGKWLSELEMDDYEYIHQCHMNSTLDDEFTTNDIATAMQQNFQQSLSSESYSSYPAFSTKNTNITTTTTTLSNSSIETSRNVSFQRPAKQTKIDSTWNVSGITQHESPKPSSSPHILSFGNPNSLPDNRPKQFCSNLDSSLKPKHEVVSPVNIHVPMISRGSIENQNHAPKARQGTKGASSVTRSTHSNAQDHIMAERKRREKLSLRFIALSAIVPGLKKMDKASVLGDAIKYVKELQERVNLLEEQTKKRTVESVVFVKKSQLSANDDTSSCDENFEGRSDEALPEIEARISDKDVLIRIHCEKNRGVVVKILGEIENLHLSVVNSSVLPFGNSTLDITVIAQMDNEFDLTAKDLVKTLRVAL